LTLASTAGIEAPIVAALCPRRAARLAFAVAILVNLASHPSATALASIAGVDWLLVEALVVGFEALVLRAVLDLTPGRALGVSLLANLVTASIALAWSRA
jgi:hypothetical protein